MRRTYQSPGVYLAPPPAPTADVRLVRTDIAGFVGYAERGPVAPLDSRTLDDPQTLAVPLSSWKEYRAKFGGLTPYAYMPYAVRAFFENGGTKCYVVRIAASSARESGAAPQVASHTPSLGDDAVSVTTLTQTVQLEEVTAPPLGNDDYNRDIVARDAQVSVDSTAGLSVGAVVGLGAPDEMVLATVKKLDDGQHMTLTGPWDRVPVAGAPVSLLAATALSADQVAGQTDVMLAEAALFQVGDIVALSAPGKIQYAAVAAFTNPTTIRLDRKLKGEYAKEVSFLRRQKSGLRIEAKSPGNWGKRLRIDATPRSLAPKLRFDVRVTLAPGPDATQPPEEEFFPDLSLARADYRYAPVIINDADHGSNLIRLVVPDGAAVELRVANGRIDQFPAELAGGRDGLDGVTVRDFVGGDGDFRGLRVLQEVDEVGILLAPDALHRSLPAPPEPPQSKPDPCVLTPQHAPKPEADDPTTQPRELPSVGGTDGDAAVYQAMIEQARRLRYRVAVLDTPDNLEPADVASWVKQLNLPPLSLPFAAIYYPWLLVPDGLTNELAARRVAPSGHIAGVYAQVDNSEGVQHPPANVELAFAVDVARHLSNPQQGQLNELGINVIRSFPGRGIRVWGARSLAASDEEQDKWWFIHVRRTMSMIEDSVEKSMQWTVFESNDENLRRTLTHSLTVLLERLWLAGGLKGTKPAQAFYVKCDATNNPQAQIDRGLLVCEVGVAVAAPMEFLTFQIRRLPDGTGVVEA
jgi:phage tail sheath protein FI